MPHSRFLLLSSRVVGQWLSTMGYFILLLLCTGIGYGLRALTDPLSDMAWPLFFSYASHMVLFIILVTTLILLIMQVTPAFYRRAYQFIILISLNMSFLLIIQLMNNWIMDGPFHAGPTPGFWQHISLLVGIGLPASVICVWLGSRYFNNYLNIRQSTSFLKQKQ